ncbi:MAG TPA: DEAD/DEAH box helicase family protein, partial [Acinetobacter johnsonii]|nr:DEAD/DEAH box helicase family protein [Acinetobacter johnsonii]
MGNYGEFLARINAEIETATDPVLREKLISQRHKASEHINHVDVNKLNLSLRATNIDISIKSDFLSIYGGDDVFVNAEGRVEVQAKVPTFDDVARWLKHGNFPSDVRVYFLNRLLDAINNNTRLTLRVPKDVSRAKHDFVMEAFLKYVREIDATFVSYLHSNEAFMQELDGKLNDPFNKEMVTELDESPIEIDGFSPQFEGFEALQTYQNAEIRRLSRRFEGITGFDVGLGKTMASIATAQNLHNIGVKKRTAFVVPSHTISKWLRDVKMTLTDHSGVLVIGSKENSLESINSANYGTDLNLLIKSKDWRIILMTSDAYTMIPLKDSSIEKYYEPKLTGYDLSKDKDRQAYNAFLADKKADMQGDKGRLPYFEDL